MKAHLDTLHNTDERHQIMRGTHCIPAFLLAAAVVLTLNHGSVNAGENIPYIRKPVGEEAFKIIRQCYEYDRDIPLDTHIVETVKRPDYTREKIVFRSVRDCTVPGYLAIPKTGSPPYPCILLLHGHTGNKGEWWQDDSFYGGGLVTKAFIPAGFAILALDAQYHGERMVHNNYESTLVSRNRGWYSRWIEMIIQSVTDYRRAIDYLETRPEIDAARIGVHGYSMGGMMTFLLTGVEPRVRVSVSCVAGNLKTEHDKYALIAPYNFARAIGKRPFLMLMGSKDTLLPEASAQMLYGLIEASSTKLIFYDSGHRLPDEYISEALRWFQTHL